VSESFRSTEGQATLPEKVQAPVQSAVSVEWAFNELEAAPSTPLREVPSEYVEVLGTVREYGCPDSFLPLLPVTAGNPLPHWSAFAQVTQEGKAWSETGLRRRVNQLLAAAQQPAAIPTSKPLSDDPAALVLQYLQALDGSMLGHLYTRVISGNGVATPLCASGWWENHQSMCSACARRGPWEVARLSNEDNPCYIADLLAILHHGYIIPFKKLPPPVQHANRDSLRASPATIQAEWQKMVDNDVFREASPEAPPRCIAPLQAVVKESDTDDALAELTRLGSVAVFDPESEGYVDQLNEALRAAGSSKVVKARLCVDLSVTINKFIAELPFQYPPVDELLEHLEPDGWLCKVDYRRCFFNIPLHPDMYGYVGVSWEDKLWEATRVVFGITLGPHAASIFTAETALVCRSRGIPGSIYVDDNAITGPTEQVCLARRTQALVIMHRAGWPVAEDKLGEDRPAQRLAYRGVVFDTRARTLSIPVPRLEATARRVKEALAIPEKGTLQVRRFKQILGRLEWINQVLPTGRARTKRLYAALPYGAENNWKLHLKALARADLDWWRAFLELACTQGGLCQWARFDVPLQECPLVRIFSDASGEMGFGSVAGDLVLAGTWQSAEAVKERSSGWKELVPIRLMLECLAPTLAEGTVVVVTTDNAGNAFAINNGKADSQELFEQLVPILDLAAQYRLRLVGDWVPREFNTLNDALSRLSPLPGHVGGKQGDAPSQEVVRRHEHGGDASVGGQDTRVRPRVSRAQN
jgi:hypothetical protein